VIFKEEMMVERGYIVDDDDDDDDGYRQLKVRQLGSHTPLGPSR